MPFKMCHHSMFLKSIELELGKSKLTHKWGVLKYHKVSKNRFAVSRIQISSVCDHMYW